MKNNSGKGIAVTQRRIESWRIEQPARGGNASAAGSATAMELQWTRQQDYKCAVGCKEATREAFEIVEPSSVCEGRLTAAAAARQTQSCHQIVILTLGAHCRRLRWLVNSVSMVGYISCPVSR